MGVSMHVEGIKFSVETKSGGHGQMLAPARWVGLGQLQLFGQEMDWEGRCAAGKLQALQFSLGRTNQQEWRRRGLEFDINSFWSLSSIMDQ